MKFNLWLWLSARGSTTPDDPLAATNNLGTGGGENITQPATVSSSQRGGSKRGDNVYQYRWW